MASSLCNVAQAVEFVHRFRADCQRVIDEDKLDIPLENFLGLSAKECGYGQSPIIKRGLNNYFSMHSPAPLEIGRSQALGNPKVFLAHYTSFYHCAKSFSMRWGNTVRGKKDPSAFANALVCSRGCYNSGNDATGGNSNFIKDLLDVIRAVKVRLSC
ncbi:MAG: hypothetical protein FWH56_09660 [Betaproteobacteria bacterium]|nr:hypothetical protein [Betaproteobacteria bacterium]